MSTFTVKGSDQVYKLSTNQPKLGYTFGSPVNENGVARKGRPSKFPTETVTITRTDEVQEALPLSPDSVGADEVLVEVAVESTPEAAAEAVRQESETFLALD